MERIDWKTTPYPWCEIGPNFREECEAIANAPRPAYRDDHQSERNPYPKEIPDAV